MANKCTLPSGLSLAELNRIEEEARMLGINPFNWFHVDDLKKMPASWAKVRELVLKKEAVHGESV